MDQGDDKVIFETGLKNFIWLRWMGWIWHRFRNVGHVCLDLTFCASRLRRSENLAMGAGEDLQPECSLFCRAEGHIQTQNTFRQCCSSAFWQGSDIQDDNPQPRPWYQLYIVFVSYFQGMFSETLSTSLSDWYDYHNPEVACNTYEHYGYSLMELQVV